MKGEPIYNELKTRYKWSPEKKAEERRKISIRTGRYLARNGHEIPEEHKDNLDLVNAYLDEIGNIRQGIYGSYKGKGNAKLPLNGKNGATERPLKVIRGGR